MPVWTCPNVKCVCEEQLKSSQRCPLCGKEARRFTFNEFGDLLKRKGKFSRSAGKNKDADRTPQRLKFCPKCGSSNLNFLIFYRPSLWECLDCGYEGAFVVEDGILAKRIREDQREN